jgi:ABC-type multidrug transport system fused ATPase/permease subunit
MAQYNLSMIQAIKEDNLSLMNKPLRLRGALILLSGGTGIAGWQDVTWMAFKRSRQTHALFRIHEFVMNNDATFHGTIDSTQIAGAADLGIESLEILDDLIRDLVPNIILAIGSVRRILCSTGLPICMVLALGVASRRLIYNLLRERQQLLQEESANLQLKIDENRHSVIRGWRTVLHSGQIDREVSIYKKRLKELEDLHAWNHVLQMLTHGLSQLLSVISSQAAQYLVVLYTASSRDPYVAIAFQGYSLVLTDVLDSFMDLPQKLWQHLYPADRLRTLMLQKSSMTYGTEDLKINEGRVQLENITFRYKSKSDTGKLVFRNFSLAFEPGKTTAIVGSSGVGKTTVLDVMSRTYEPEKGSVQIDGQDLKRVQKEE